MRFSLSRRGISHAAVDFLSRGSISHAAVDFLSRGSISHAAVDFLSRGSISHAAGARRGSIHSCEGHRPLLALLPSRPRRCSALWNVILYWRDDGFYYVGCEALCRFLSLLFNGNIPRGVFCERRSQKARDIPREFIRSV